MIILLDAETVAQAQQSTARRKGPSATGRRAVTCTWLEPRCGLVFALRYFIRTMMYTSSECATGFPAGSAGFGQVCVVRAENLSDLGRAAGFQPVERPSRWIRLERERRAGLGTRKRNVFARSDSSPFIRLHAARTLSISPLSSSPNPLPHRACACCFSREAA